MITHTKTPWRITEKPLKIVGTPETENHPIPVIANLTVLDLENARRIVACVNALSDFTTEELEAR